MKLNLSVLLFLLSLGSPVNGQVDTLKFIDGTYYVVKGGNIIYPCPPGIVDLGDGRYASVESSSQFPGGNKALMNWIGQNINVDKTLTKDIVVKAIFTINEKGLPISIVVEGDTTNGKGKEVIRLIESMPRWKPASQSGRIVKMRSALPITFSKKNKRKK